MTDPDPNLPPPVASPRSSRGPGVKRPADDSHPAAPPRWREAVVWMALGLTTWIVAGLLGRAPGLVERVYASGVGPIVAVTLSRLTGLLPLSVAEWLVAGFAGWTVAAAVGGVRDARAGRRSWGRVLVAGALRLGRDAGVIVTLFYLFWGFNYARAPLDVRLGWPGWEGMSPERVEAAAVELIDATNDAYLAIHDTADAGVPTTLPVGRRQLSRTLETGWERARVALDLPGSVAWRFGPVKPLLSSPVFARLGITGIYFPFTGEANVRTGLPAVAAPLTAAHEQAHQRGIAVEAEASFLGYLAAALSGQPHARYSALVFAQTVVLNGLARRDPERWRRLVEGRLPGVRRDIEDLRAYYARFRGVGTRVGSAVNDRFLRANRIEEGVLNYGLAGRLILTWSVVNGGSVVPELPATRSPEPGVGR